MNPYKIFILKYARREAYSSELILGDTQHLRTELAYYLWVVTNGEHTVGLDMGFTEATSQRRKRQWLRDPRALMDDIHIDPKTLQHVVISHMHWDHVGNYEMFPRARFYLQEREMAFWTGRQVRQKTFNRSIEVEDVAALIRCNYDGRMALADGTREIVPGVKVHGIGGGHTAGIQILEVETASGPAVLAADAAHLYRNLKENVPFTTLHDIPHYVDGFDLMRGLAKDEDHILPGHDAEVMRRYRNQSDFVAVME
jgi:glyoxylase-like metal-dependent hydrolase (beta-lactamase superfamily II)